MNCRHCLAWNAADEHRCRRCGRRAGYANPAPETYPFDTTPVMTATAPDFLSLATRRASLRSSERSWEPSFQLSTTTAVADREPRIRPVYQRALFDTQVVELPVKTASRATRQRAASPRRVRRTDESQQGFDFDTPEIVETLHAPGISCGAPVAQPLHRVLAACLDFSMIFMALGLFLLTFQVCGGDVVLNSKTAWLYGGILGVLWFFYQSLFGICGGDTPGMVWTNLRLTDFDGNTPDREQRVYRIFGGALGFLSAGLGLIWSLVDEEQLTWHDHISKTFPTPIEM